MQSSTQKKVTRLGSVWLNGNGYKSHGRSNISHVESVSGGSSFFLPVTVAEMLCRDIMPTWNSVLQAFQDGRSVNRIEVDTMISLCALYNLALFRRTRDSSEHVIHFDTMLMNRGADIWRRSPEMSHWLTEQGLLAGNRAKAGRRTSRVFYFTPPIESHQALIAFTETLFRHVYSGIDAYLVESQCCSQVLDCTILSASKGILTELHSGNVVFRDAVSASDVAASVSVFQEVLELVRTGDAIHFPLGTSMQQIIESLMRFVDE